MYHYSETDRIEPRTVPRVTLYVEDPPEQNAVESSWLDFVNERIRDRVGKDVELGWAVEDTKLHWGLVHGTKPGEAVEIVKILERLREEWAVWPEQLPQEVR